MRILFIHQSFPGPFQHIATHFGALPGTTVLFLSERHRREIRIPGVRRLLVSAPQGVASTDSAEREILLALRRGANVANALLRLQHEGFHPDIVCASAGAGSGFYVADIFPEAFRAVYADWFYTKGVNYNFFSRGASRSPADFAPGRVRNLCQFNALFDCDFAVTSTNWQKAQFPAAFAKSIQVLHQGIDTDFFSPAPDERFVVDGCDMTDVPELVTYSGRSLEPFRGFPHFARSLPLLLAARPACHVLIMAAGRKESDEASDRALSDSLAFLTPAERNRVHFLGFRPYEDYRRLLRASTVHVYLTAPFALSSGLFEAMSCGCLLAGSDTEPVREVIRHGENGFLCGFGDETALAQTVIGLLQRSSVMNPIRAAARQTILDQYDIKKLAPKHAQRLLDAYAQKTQTRF
ncbi:MAG: glycosyltransferase [Bilophila sp.]